MDEKMTGFTGGWGIVIFLIILFWAFLGGGFNRGMGYGNNVCRDASNCDVEIQTLKNTAATNYRIIEENRRSTDMISQQLRNQWDAQQGEKLFDLKMNNLAQQNAFNLALSEKNATIERMTLASSLDKRFDQMGAAIADIKCHMLPKPDITGIGAVCPNAGIINGLGFNGSCGYGCGGCGYGYGYNA